MGTAQAQPTCQVAPEGLRGYALLRLQLDRWGHIHGGLSPGLRIRPGGEDEQPLSLGVAQQLGACASSLRDLHGATRLHPQGCGKLRLWLHSSVLVFGWGNADDLVFVADLQTVDLENDVWQAVGLKAALQDLEKDSIPGSVAPDPVQLSHVFRLQAQGSVVTASVLHPNHR